MTFSKDKKTRFYKQRRISSLIKSGFACLTVTTQFLYPDEFTIANNNNKVNQKNLFFVYIFYILFIFVLHRGIVSYKKKQRIQILFRLCILHQSISKNKKAPDVNLMLLSQSKRQDLNLRPLRPERSALPS